MEHPIHGANEGVVAKLPMNLQLFSEAEPEEPANVEWESFDSDKPQPEVTPVVEPDTSEENPEVADPEKEEQPPQRDFEKDKAFAELRRKAEEAERRAKAQDEWAKAQYGHLGINNMDDYQKYLDDHKKRETYAEKGIDYDEVKRLVGDELKNHPDVVRGQQAQQEAIVQRELLDFNNAYPDTKISSIDEVWKLPNSDAIVDRVRRGYSLKDAYELANQSEIISKRVAAAEQAARNKMNSKGHMRPGNGGGAGEVFVVPDEVMSMYEKTFAKELRKGTMTREEIVQHYKKSVKG